MNFKKASTRFLASELLILGLAEWTTIPTTYAGGANCMKLFFMITTLSSLSSIVNLDFGLCHISSNKRS